ncbi:class I SAM-dependent methyltransferase [Kribbella sp. NPDC051718]|uniref:class I SAM-dependent methyltransferase n=1 Tax=Kribbella sp. NPDC051718 TaxID=3155168 RepID=UPI00341375BF
MTFGKDYWNQHWQPTTTAMERNPPNPYLVDATANLTPGTALDAGCGAGAEAIWLASQGWQVTAADISRTALDKAIHHAAGLPITWLEADLTVWTPDTQYDLVTTHYAHPTIPQLAFYHRLSTWVAPGGTLLLVGHLHTPHSDPEHEHGGHGHSGRGHQPPAEASVGLADITAGLDDAKWEIVAAGEHTRTIPGRSADLRDVVVQATLKPRTS